MSQEYIGAVARRRDLEVIRADQKALVRPFYLVLKRVFDIVMSVCGLVMLSPVFLVLAALVYLSDPGPVFYKHERLGKGGRKIGIWKFRSMYINSEELFERLSEKQKEEFYRDFKLENDPRITRIGNFLRKSSLDELPQLWNILCGDMSFVGPRPIVDKELEKYGKYAGSLLSVKPGLTGYWQANGRNLVNYGNGRQEMELYYVENQCAFLDLKILWQTAGAVLGGKGAQ